MHYELHLGFTGTRKGMSKAQRATLRLVLRKMCGWFHHGDAIGSDEQAHEIASELGYRIMIHPSDRKDQRAFCKTEPGWLFLEHPPLLRNRHIVANSDRLIACPLRPEEGEGGTWYTVRYARQMHRPIKIILPNGKTRSENWEPLKGGSDAIEKERRPGNLHT